MALPGFFLPSAYSRRAQRKKNQYVRPCLNHHPPGACTLYEGWEWRVLDYLLERVWGTSKPPASRSGRGDAASNHEDGALQDEVYFVEESHKKGKDPGYTQTASAQDKRGAISCRKGVPSIAIREDCSRQEARRTCTTECRTAQFGQTDATQPKLC